MYYILPDGDYFDPNGYYFDKDGYDENGVYFDAENREYIYKHDEEFEEEKEHQ